ncbi:hypothetical protein K2224_34010 (plasmid) [Streptomyces sp. BHT-5-2]|uniref:hypothetical protein n=1 Tax=Streptomyces sp. BHT-5-2 TaxID=2866715 RepID=UPI001C8E7CF5|nr:hypothetical protein [Streptomyces sp. BHT-5-2]QZL08157.1 hypothetical protein K2224_34010 [Streptomyces sp. BHT-5-2]
MEQLSGNVDRDILEDRTILAIKAIRESFGCTLREAVDVYAQRYEELRRDCPDGFHLSRAEPGRIN